MAAYAYKYVRDRLPQFIIDKQVDYEGDGNYDGDQWYAAADYIDYLEDAIVEQFKVTGEMKKELYEFFKTDKSRYYGRKPRIKDGD